MKPFTVNLIASIFFLSSVLVIFWIVTIAEKHHTDNVKLSDREAYTVQRVKSFDPSDTKALSPTETYEVFRQYGIDGDFENMWKMFDVGHRAEFAQVCRALLSMSTLARSHSLSELNDFEIFKLLMNQAKYEKAMVTGETIAGDTAIVSVLSFGHDEAKANDIRMIKVGSEWKFVSFF